MNKVYPEGTILVWINIHETSEAPVSGKRYIVQRRRAGGEYEVTVKTYLSNKSGQWLIAESDHPEFQSPIKISDAETETVIILGRVVRSIRPE